MALILGKPPDTLVLLSSIDDTSRLQLTMNAELTVLLKKLPLSL